MDFCRLIVVALAYMVHGAASGQHTGVHPTQEWEQKDEKARVDELVGLARALAPVISADILLRFSKTVSDAKIERELLLEAFELSRNVESPFPATYLGTLSMVSAGLLSDGIRQQGLDRLSIRCRVVNHLLRIDPLAAKDLFLRIESPTLSEHSCENVFVEDPSILYKTLELVARSGFTEEERKREEHVDLIASHIRDVASPQQMPGMIAATLKSQMSEDHLRLLVPLVAERLRSLRRGDPAFTFAMEKLALDRQIGELAHRAAELGLDRTRLVSDYRAFLVENLNSLRCVHTFSLYQLHRTMPGRDWVASFNLRLAPERAFSNTTVGSIESDEIKKARVVGSPAMSPAFAQGTTAAVVRKELNVLEFDLNTGLPLPVNAKKTLAWRTRMDALLAHLERWQPDSEDTIENHFITKCHLYSALLRLPQSEDLIEKVVRSYVSYLALNLVVVNPQTWVFFVTELASLDSAQENDDSQGGPSDASRTDWITRATFREFARSTCPELYAYTLLIPKASSSWSGDAQ